ncbi:stonustoxin subunit beta-like [Scomber scombrus]|uniref:stonustoxin subunit beta-like n=1 Tax=Scomber scombrus TaxID=13677 RepID=UPI002DDBF9F5|nr:stonustoxin subunit beta-like [Scomber scombrus]
MRKLLQVHSDFVSSSRLDHGGEQRLKPVPKRFFHLIQSHSHFVNKATNKPSGVLDDKLLLYCVSFSSSDFCELTVDPNTVNRNLKLSDNNRKVTAVTEKQPYPDHPDRFDAYYQLLCTEGLTDRCYWEVEWRGTVHISVSYRGIRRKGNSTDCWFGGYNQSWCLRCFDDGRYSVWHNKEETVLPSSSVSNRVAVYVDCPAGTLSFYRVSSDTLIHLHTFNTRFTEPLYAGFRLGPGSSVSLCSV